MVATDTNFAGSIPETYDRYLVPLIFQHFADDLAGRAAASQPRDVLETAAGTGVLTRALAARLPADARIVATDLNQAMLDRAMARQAGDGRIAWRQADALSLPFAGGGFDVVACQFGAMFFPDRPRGFAEARRMLRPGGRLLFSVWDGITENAFADAVVRSLAHVFPEDPPRFLARTPHGYTDRDRIRDDVVAAGFREVAIEAVAGSSRAPSALEVAVAFCQGTPMRGEIEARGAGGLAEATRAVAEALAAEFGEGAVEGPMQAVVVAAAG